MLNERIYEHMLRWFAGHVDRYEVMTPNLVFVLLTQEPDEAHEKLIELEAKVEKFQKYYNVKVYVYYTPRSFWDNVRYFNY